MVLSLFGCRGKAPLDRELTDAAIREMLEERVTSGRNAAIVVGILENGARRTIAYGVRAAGADSIDEHTVFEIGSITKVFTASLLAAMVQRGEVRLDDPIAKYLPPTVRAPSRAGRQITLLDLSTQHSGLPRLPGNLRPADADNPYADYTVDDLYRFLSTHSLKRDVGEKFEYSNLGVGLLGHVLARRAGASYEAALTERLLDPLGLDDTRIRLSRDMAARLAVGHTPRGRVAKNWDLGALAGAGGLRSTSDDLLTFAAAHFDSTGPLFQVLQMTLHAQRSLGATGGDSIGLNWLLMRSGDGAVAWHNGGTGGYRSFLGLDRGRRRAVVVLTSTATSVDDLGMMLLRDGGSGRRSGPRSAVRGQRPGVGAATSLTSLPGIGPRMTRRNADRSTATVTATAQLR
jgi:CubicO group peptidase (beta-lactamase class C family)